MSNHSAYPLQWPKGWPVTVNRESSRFKCQLASALRELKREVELLGGKGLVLSSNVTLGAERPKNPGVCAYFQLGEKAMAIPCDRWRKVEDNVHAIALTVEAIRGMDRWGAKHMITAMFQGFTALPERTGPSPWDILWIPAMSNEQQIMDAWKRKAQLLHPDKGGTNEAMIGLNEAKDIALATVRAR